MSKVNEVTLIERIQAIAGPSYSVRIVYDKALGEQLIKINWGAPSDGAVCSAIQYRPSLAEMNDTDLHLNIVQPMLDGIAKVS